MKKTLQEFLDKDLSPDKVKDMDLDKLINILIDNKIVNRREDINMIIIEAVQNAFKQDDEFPITYYFEDSEEIPPEHKLVDSGPCLTDEYIESNLSN